MSPSDPRAGPAYDALASAYDAQLAENPVALEMRAQLHRHLAGVFRSGARVLDVTAGTGVDACFLAARGVRVTALDISAGMIAELEKKAARLALPIDARVLPAECLEELGAPRFDGALSTFGGLNVIPDLPRLARDLGRLVRPGGTVIFHALGDFCFWQWVRGIPRTRQREIRVGGLLLLHRFYNPFLLWRDVFYSRFDLRQVYALSVIATPRLARRLGRAAPALFRLDRAAGRLFPAAGDFFVMELERRGD